MTADERERTVVKDFIVPASHGRGFVVEKGQTLRIEEVEGKQVVDATFQNADNLRETFHAGQSMALNMLGGTGNLKQVRYLYSRPPYENVLMTVTDDPVGVNFAWMGGRCTRAIYEFRNERGIGERVQVEGHRTCQQNLEEALAPFGVEPDEIPDVFNIWMNNDDEATVRENHMVFLPPVADLGDYIELRAEMNVLVGISACPNDQDDVNAGTPKPLGIKILAA
ncbi:MAG: uncharacterized protein V7644_1072 [Actinomycetota bacterium]|jgi:uncharacterized protein YcgI (DUF1989 family)